MNKNNLYIAGPLFNEAEKSFNRQLKKILSPYYEIYLPQEDGGLMIDMIHSGIPPDIASNEVFNIDIQAINKCDFLLLILDGRTIDEGAAFELGYAYALGKKILGLRTDARQLFIYGNNPMIENALDFSFSSIDELVEWSKSEVLHNKSFLNDTNEF